MYHFSEQGKINKSPYLNMSVKASRKIDVYNKQLKNLEYDTTPKHGKYD
jgi:hypothetical protein